MECEQTLISSTEYKLTLNNTFFLISSSGDPDHNKEILGFPELNSQLIFKYQGQKNKKGDIEYTVSKKHFNPGPCSNLS